MEAIRRGLDRRRREELRRSLRNPHPEGAGLETEALVDSSAGAAVRWIPSAGWVEGRE